MGAQEDLIVPVEQFYSQVSDLKNVRSLTAQLFTRADHARLADQIAAFIDADGELASVPVLASANG